MWVKKALLTIAMPRFALGGTSEKGSRHLPSAMPFMTITT